MKIVFKSENEGERERLDKFLTEQMGDKTRSQVQKVIEAGLVLVEGVVKSSNYKLKDGEEVEVLDKEKQVKKDTGLNFEVVFENDEFIVINKPAGLIVHGASHIAEITLADLLVKKYPELKGVGEGEERPGIVHRLDKDASGLMVVARTEESFKSLKKQFQDRTVEKKYLALAYGEVPKEHGIIDFPIKRSTSGNKQAAVPESFDDDEDGIRDAVTEYDVIKRFVNYTLLSIGIKTGRKHQIRVHMSAYGHPVVGDPLYKTKRLKERNKKLDLGRIFLVAYKLSFKDADGEQHDFEIELPTELKDFLENLK